MVEILTSKPPKALRRLLNPNSPPQNVRDAVSDYGDAYFRLYGVRAPEYTYERATGYIRLGQSAGVSLRRLQELTRQICRRLGDD